MKWLMDAMEHVPRSLSRVAHDHLHAVCTGMLCT